MHLANYANLTPARLAGIERELSAHRMLADVLRWGLGAESGVRLPEVIAEVIVQDEYTHDVVIPWRDELVLVYGTT